MTEFTGKTIRGYELHESIGSGGFGAVYRAHQAGVGRDVAIKIILPQFAQLPEFSQRFESEAQIIARLEHIHIVPLFDYWKDEDGTAFIVMRWLKGGNLRSKLKHGPLTHYDVARLVEQISEALALAHQHGIIHRDIKPGNILFDEHFNAYLSDFGIAKDTVQGLEITAAGKTPSTPAYAAPEQIMGQEVTPRADIYSLGMTVYEALAGKYPFPDSPLQHLRDMLPPLNPDEVTALDTVLLQATAKDVSARFPDVTRFADAIQRSLGFQATRRDKTTPIRIAAPLDTKPRADIDTAETITPIPTPGDVSSTLIESALDIPLRPDQLVGRGAVLDAVENLLDNGQRVLLQGFAGIGKTAIAAELVARRLERGPALWLHVGSEDAITLLIALARPFDAHRLIAVLRDGTETQAVRKLLDEKGVKLVVIDDAWDGAVLKRIVDALPPETGLLVTSRHRFPVGKIVAVDALAPDDALNLLNAHAGEEYTGTEATKLCDRLGYHPYALEIAGKLMLVDELTPADVLQEIGETPHLLEMPEDYAEAGRTTIDHLLKASLATLTNFQRDTFLAFGGLFAPQATADLLALCMDAGSQAAAKAMTTLHRRGLAQQIRLPKGGRVYRLHDLAYSHAIANTPISPVAVIGGCLAYVREYKADLDALDAERTNILKAVESAGKAGDNWSMVQIMNTLIVEGPYLTARGHDQLLLDQLDAAIEAARAEDDKQIRHRLLGKRGDAYYDRGDLPNAINYFTASLELAQELDLVDRQVVVLSVMSKAYADQGNYRTAEAKLETAQKLAADAQDDELLARVLENWGYYYAEAQKNMEKAREAFAEQVELAQKTNNLNQMFYSLQNLGAAHLELGQLDEAFQSLTESLEIARANDRHQWIANALYPIAAIHDMRDQHDKAQECFAETVQLYRQVGRTTKATEVLNYMKKAGYTLEDE